MADNNALTIFEPQNVQTIATLAPQSYDKNLRSHDGCLNFGEALLQRVQAEGMSDILDQEISLYLEKTRKTLKLMNERRTPVTQMFDQIRKAYTALENDVDPAKSDTIPYQLQVCRNAYARKKHEEEEQRRREEAARIAKENAKTRYRADVEDDYAAQFNALVNKSINELNDLDKTVTLDNYTERLTAIRQYNCELPKGWCQTVVSRALRPAELSPTECNAIQANVMAGLADRFTKQYPFEVQSVRDDILDRLPSKNKELERIALASAEEAARIKAQMEAREREEAARKESERIEREKQEAAKAQLNAQKQEMDGLFGLPVAEPTAYQPKTQVKKKVVIRTADDVMKVVVFWWSQEGCNKSVDDLCKEFKKQITYANTMANSKSNPVTIVGMDYEDDVKAK